MNVTIQTLKQHVPRKKAYSILDVIKNHMVSTEQTAVAGAVVYSFDLDEAYVKFMELAQEAYKAKKMKLFDNYCEYLDLFKKMKDETIDFDKFDPIDFTNIQTKKKRK